MKITIRELQSMGFGLKINGEKLVVTPASKITPEIRERIRESRDDIYNKMKSVPRAKRKRTASQKAAPVSVNTKSPVEKVGTEMSKLIPDWTTKDTSGCGCKSWIKKMDRWGVEGCETRRKAIVDHLVAQKKYLIAPLRIVPDSVARIGAEKLLDQAIANAKHQ